MGEDISDKSTAKIYLASSMLSDDVLTVVSLLTGAGFDIAGISIPPIAKDAATEWGHARYFIKNIDRLELCNSKDIATSLYLDTSTGKIMVKHRQQD